MSRRRRSRRTQFTKRAVTRRVQREVKRPFTRFSDLLDRKKKPYQNDLIYVQDKRTYPWRYDPVERLVDGRPAHVTVSSRTRQEARKRRVPSALRFANPKRVITCIRRRTRRQVLFALKKTGKGSGAKRRRYTDASHIRC